MWKNNARLIKGLLFAVSFLVCALLPLTVYANVGDMGFFGGISEGRRLPKTTELMLASTNNRNQTAQTEFIYKEPIFLSGNPVVFEGLLSIRSSGAVNGTDKMGTYTETYRVTASATTEADIRIERIITFNVNWRREENQIIRDYQVRTWSETVTTPENVFVLDSAQSYFDISILEDHPAGVTYYRGDMSQRSVYTIGSGTDSITLEASGSFYGYNSAWSNTETHRIDYVLYTDDWQMQYQVRPSVSAGKTLQYTPNEPTAISFAGNYKEVMYNETGLSYDIFIKPQRFYDIKTSDSINILINNTFEQLIAPDLSFLRGHFAEEDIKKLFAMQVLTGETLYYKPEQAITRGQFVTALVKAIKLPIEQVTPTTRARTPVTAFTFPDVPQTDPYYPFIMAAYKAGIAIGRSNGYFYSDSTIEREEALVIMLRALGLVNLAYNPTPTTFFSDDDKISSWAKRELYAAERIGLIAGDEDNNINPKAMVSKAEAAAFLNRLIEYMRSDLKTDYADHIVNYPN